MDPKKQFQFTKQGSKHSSRNQSSKLHKGTCLSKPNILQHMRAIIITYLHICTFCFSDQRVSQPYFFQITWKLWSNRCLKGRTWKNSGLTGNNIIPHIPGFARQMVSNKITTQNTSVNGIQLRMSTRTWINITARLVFPDKIHCGLFDSIKTLETAKFRNNGQFSYRFQPVPIQNRRIHPTPTCLKNLEHWGKSGNHSWNQVGP